MRVRRVSVQPFPKQTRTLSLNLSLVMGGRVVLCLLQRFPRIQKQRNSWTIAGFQEHRAQVKLNIVTFRGFLVWSEFLHPSPVFTGLLGFHVRCVPPPRFLGLFTLCLNSSKTLTQLSPLLFPGVYSNITFPQSLSWLLLHNETITLPHNNSSFQAPHPVAFQSMTFMTTVGFGLFWLLLPSLRASQVAQR